MLCVPWRLLLMPCSRFVSFEGRAHDDHEKPPDLPHALRRLVRLDVSRPERGQRGSRGEDAMDLLWMNGWGGWQFFFLLVLGGSGFGLTCN